MGISKNRDFDMNNQPDGFNLTDIFENAKNLCNPLNQDGGDSLCSMACIDRDYNKRIGTYYPNLTADFSFDDCPEFWQNRKITVNVMNAMAIGNWQLAMAIAIGLDISVGIYSFAISLYYGGLKWHYNNSKDKVGPIKLCPGFGKAKFLVSKIIIGFGMPLTDTISDSFYFGRLESKSPIVHVEPAVITALAVFVYLAIVKDAIYGVVIYYFYKGEHKISN